VVSLTRRFGLSKFGGRLGGSPSDNGGKYSNVDRDTIDRLLSAFEVHHHDGGTVLADPTTAPTTVVSTVGGTLPAGTTFYYRFSLLDANGLETAGSPEASVATAGPIMPPAAPSLEASTVTGGTLATGLYYYALSCLVDGQETPITSPSLMTVAPDRNAVTLYLPSLPTGAQSFKIWRQRSDESGFSTIGTTTAGTFVDNGSVASNACPTDPLYGPSPVNRTNSHNSIVVTLPSGLPNTPWRLYRTTSAGNYSGPSLVAAVVQTTGESGGPIVTTYTDTGAPALDGGPVLQSQVLAPSTPLNATNVSITVAGAHYATGSDVQTAVSQLDAVVGGGGSGTAIIPRLVILTDSAASRWALGVDDTGHLLASTYVGSMTGYGYNAGPIFSDGTSNWRFGIDPTGHVLVVSTSVAQDFSAGLGPVLVDSLGGSWRLGVDATGHPILTGFMATMTMYAPFDGPLLMAPNGQSWRLGVNNLGTLTLEATA
jgi:hypothetical protein